MVIIHFGFRENRFPAFACRDRRDRFECVAKHICFESFPSSTHFIEKLSRFSRRPDGKLDTRIRAILAALSYLRLRPSHTRRIQIFMSKSKTSLRDR